MRFAGQRFRSPRQGMPNYRAQSGAIGKYSGRTPVSGIEGAMVSMPEPNARSMSFTEMPAMGKSPVSAGNFQEPDFRAPTRAA